MSMDPSYLNRLLNADGHLSVRKLGLLGPEFWQAMRTVLDARFKFDDDLAQLERALDGLAASVKVIADIARKAVR